LPLFSSRFLNRTVSEKKREVMGTARIDDKLEVIAKANYFKPGRRQVDVDKAVRNIQAQLAKAKDGFTIDPRTGRTPTRGTQVAIDLGHRRITTTEDKTWKEVADTNSKVNARQLRERLLRTTPLPSIDAGR
jgi:hypothetical protein